jgi:hypothetical protein
MKCFLPKSVCDVFAARLPDPWGFTRQPFLAGGAVEAMTVRAAGKDVLRVVRPGNPPLPSMSENRET